MKREEIVKLAAELERSQKSTLTGEKEVVEMKEKIRLSQESVPQRETELLERQSEYDRCIARVKDVCV